MTATPPELLAELDTCLADSLRRAANRAEHIRLTRIQGLVLQLRQQLAPVSSTGLPTGDGELQLPVEITQITRLTA